MGHVNYRANNTLIAEKQNTLASAGNGMQICGMARLGIMPTFLVVSTYFALKFGCLRVMTFIEIFCRLDWRLTLLHVVTVRCVSNTPAIKTGWHRP
jgi:hypothetical protein